MNTFFQYFQIHNSLPELKCRRIPSKVLLSAKVKVALEKHQRSQSNTAEVPSFHKSKRSLESRTERHFWGATVIVVCPPGFDLLL